VPLLDNSLDCYLIIGQLTRFYFQCIMGTKIAIPEILLNSQHISSISLMVIMQKLTNSNSTSLLYKMLMLSILNHDKPLYLWLFGLLVSAHMLLHSLAVPWSDRLNLTACQCWFSQVAGCHYCVWKCHFSNRHHSGAENHAR
jgi:hypothetical protein